MTENLQQMKSALERAGIPFDDIRVFGRIRCNVHILCKSRATADKWARLLSRVFPGSAPSVTATAWHSKKNRGTRLLPTTVRGFLVAIISA